MLSPPPSYPPSWFYVIPSCCLSSKLVPISLMHGMFLPLIFPIIHRACTHAWLWSATANATGSPPLNIQRPSFFFGWCWFPGDGVFMCDCNVLYSDLKSVSSILSDSSNVLMQFVIWCMWYLIIIIPINSISTTLFPVDWGSVLDYTACVRLTKKKHPKLFRAPIIN